jgi:hypothetical protein
LAKPCISYLSVKVRRSPAIRRCALAAAPPVGFHHAGTTVTIQVDTELRGPDQHDNSSPLLPNQP